MFFDVVSFNLFDWEGDYITLNTDFEDSKAIQGRPRGLFVEPAFFGVFMGIVLTLVMQFENNSNQTIFSLSDCIVIFLALVFSSSASSIFIALLFASYYILFRGNILSSLKSAFRSSFLTVFLVSLLIAGGAGTIVTYNISRLTNIAALEDSSSVGRLLGSTLFSAKVASEKPFTGIGLGGANLALALDEDFVSQQLLGNNLQDVGYSTATHWAGLITTSGVPGLILYYIFILGRLFVSPSTRVLATGILVVGITGGQIYSFFSGLQFQWGFYFKEFFMKKINVIFPYNSIGGAFRSTYEICNRLKKRGYDPVVYFPFFPILGEKKLLAYLA